jgi:membrane-associated phospholipid phosphatase
VLAAVIVTVWVHAFKQATHVPRPLAALGPGQFHLAGPGYRGLSFPSGHAAAIFTLVGIWVMGLAPRPLVRMLLLLLAALVGLSRVMVGVHWPLDILWGMLGGWLAAAAGLALSARLGWRTSGPAGFAAGCVLLVLAAALVLSRHIGIPAVLPLQRAIGMVCLLWGAAEMLRMLPRSCQRRVRRRWRYLKSATVSRGRTQDSRESGNTIHD